MGKNTDRISAWALRLLIYISGILCLDIGIGTVIPALTVGRMIQVYNRLTGKRLEEIRERSKRGA